VLQGGDVRQQMLTLNEGVDQERLTRIANRITNDCYGMFATEIATRADTYLEMERDITQLVGEIMQRADAFSAGDIYRDGITNVLNQPEFVSSENARSALRLLEERGFLEEVLAKALSPRVGGVQVIIAGEGAWEELKEVSMILARYGAQGYATGAMGVLGPIRMSYGRTISAVRYVAGLMTDLVIEAFAD